METLRHLFSRARTHHICQQHAPALLILQSLITYFIARFVRPIVSPHVVHAKYHHVAAIATNIGAPTVAILPRAFANRIQ